MLMLASALLIALLFSAEQHFTVRRGTMDPRFIRLCILLGIFLRATVFTVVMLCAGSLSLLTIGLGILGAAAWQCHHNLRQDAETELFLASQFDLPVKMRWTRQNILLTKTLLPVSIAVLLINGSTGLAQWLSVLLLTAAAPLLLWEKKLFSIPKGKWMIKTLLSNLCGSLFWAILLLQRQLAPEEGFCFLAAACWVRFILFLLPTLKNRKYYHFDRSMLFGSKNNSFSLPFWKQKGWILPFTNGLLIAAGCLLLFYVSDTKLPLLICPLTAWVNIILYLCFKDLPGGTKVFGKKELIPRWIGILLPLLALPLFWANSSTIGQVLKISGIALLILVGVALIALAVLLAVAKYKERKEEKRRAAERAEREKNAIDFNSLPLEEQLRVYADMIDHPFSVDSLGNVQANFQSVMMAKMALSIKLNQMRNGAVFYVPTNEKTGEWLTYEAGNGTNYYCYTSPAMAKKNPKLTGVLKEVSADEFLDRCRYDDINGFFINLHCYQVDACFDRQFLLDTK